MGHYRSEMMYPDDEPVRKQKKPEVSNLLNEEQRIQQAEGMVFELASRARFGLKQLCEVIVQSDDDVKYDDARRAVLRMIQKGSLTFDDDWLLKLT